MMDNLLLSDDDGPPPLERVTREQMNWGMGIDIFETYHSPTVLIKKGSCHSSLMKQESEGIDACNECF